MELGWLVGLWSSRNDAGFVDGWPLVLGLESGNRRRVLDRPAHLSMGQAGVGWTELPSKCGSLVINQSLICLSFWKVLTLRKEQQEKREKKSTRTSLQLPSYMYTVIHSLLGFVVLNEVS